jgi:hypothetical protein
MTTDQNPYPPPDASDYRIRQLELWKERAENRFESMNIARLEDKITYVQTDIGDVKRELREHILEVKPLLKESASRSGFATGIRAWVQYGLLTALLLLGGIVNLYVAFK